MDQSSSDDNGSIPLSSSKTNASRPREGMTTSPCENTAMPFSCPEPWHAKSTETVCATLATTRNGLSDAEAEQRLRLCGRNELRAKEPKTTLRMIREHMADPMILILIGAAILSACLDEWTEGFVILAIVILNTIIGIVQEKKAESALEALRSMNTPHAKALRQGEESIIPSSMLVPGDIVFLEDGSMVPADIRLIESSNLQIQEASLTGESLPSSKNATAELPENCPLGDRKNMAYASSIVTYGRGTGIVTATGMHTEVGRIAGMLDNQDELDTPLKRKLNAVGKTLTIVGIIVCVLIFALGFLYQRPLVPQLMIAISLAISIIPEGLPATATIVMALGVQRMAKRNALVRKLPAVETLGNATVICSDKTGTLTLNRMTVTHLAAGHDLAKGTVIPLAKAVGSPAPYARLIHTAALCNNAALDPDRAGEIIGDPTEGALIHLAAAFGSDQAQLETAHPRLLEHPFDSDRKRMSTVNLTDGQHILYTKGAPDSILSQCTSIFDGSEIRPITQEDRERIAAIADAMSEQALRVLGFAIREIDTLPATGDENLEHGLTFVGLAGMIDPPRKEVAESVRICREAGIRTVMITGDHRNTARAIAQELGIWHPGDTIVTGEELSRMTPEQLDAAVKTTTVFARVSPADKLDIIQSLKRNGEIAAMTGDGVNDSPALKAADIGVTMGITGTDVAKGASDMILLDDSFTTIAQAIKEGRRVYRNIQKVIQFLLVGNIAEIATLFIATLLNWQSPLLGVHILWVNLATATLPALALGVDPADRHIMKYKPVKSGTLFERDLITRVVSQGLFVAAMTLAAYWYGNRAGGHATGQTMAFSVLALSQMLRSFNQRSNTSPIWVRAEGHNPWLWVAFAVSAALMACLLFIPSLQQAFRLTWLSGTEWAIVAGVSFLSIVQMEITKLVRKLRNRDAATASSPHTQQG